MYNLVENLEVSEPSNWNKKSFLELLLNNLEKTNLIENDVKKIKELLIEIKIQIDKQKLSGYNIEIIDMFDNIKDCFTCNTNFKFNNNFKDLNDCIAMYDKMKEYYFELPLFKSILVKEKWLNAENKIVIKNDFKNVLNKEIKVELKNKIKALIEISTYGIATGCLCSEYRQEQQKSFLNDINLLKEEITKLSN